MPKAKVSATVSPDRLARAREVTGTDSVSELLDEALVALIERELERRWLHAHPDEELPGEVVPGLAALPWATNDAVAPPWRSVVGGRSR